MINDPAHDLATLLFYATEASAYGTRSDNIGASKGLTRFLAALPKGAAVLDLGCGTGRDTQTIIAAGFDVTAIDGSAEMAREAEKRTGRPVRVLLFEDLDYVEAFGAVWASASLLHVPRPALPHVLSLVHRALRPQGLLFANFKSGGAEGRDELGRYYNYLSDDELTAALHASGGWSAIAIDEGRGVGYDGKETGFVSCTARRA
jgi:SAM-dependent methyltransferase